MTKDKPSAEIVRLVPKTEQAPKVIPEAVELIGKTLDNVNSGEIEAIGVVIRRADGSVGTAWAGAAFDLIAPSSILTNRLVDAARSGD